jgi:hypothetical protein
MDPVANVINFIILRYEFFLFNKLWDLKRRLPLKELSSALFRIHGIAKVHNNIYIRADIL